MTISSLTQSCPGKKNPCLIKQHTKRNSALRPRQIIPEQDKKNNSHINSVFKNFTILPNCPSPRQKPCFKPPTAHTLAPKHTLSADIKDAAQSLVKLEFEYVRGKCANEKLKCPPELVKARKDYLNPSEQNLEKARQLLIQQRTALWYAWDSMDSTAACDPQNGGRLLKYVHKMKQQCLDTITITLQKTSSKKYTLLCVTLDTKSHIPSNDSKKFSCAAQTSCPKKTYTKDKTSKQTWQQQLAVFKKIKQALSRAIQSTVERDLKEKSAECGPLSLPIKIALADFSYLLSKSLQEDSSFNIQSEVLNDMCMLMDGYCKNNGPLATDNYFKNIYAEVSYKSLPKGAVNLYNYTEEFFRKQNKFSDEPTFIHHLNAEIAGRWQACLNDICNYLKQKISDARAIEIVERQKLNTHDMEATAMEISDYLIRVIKIHKNLSYNRFISLFTQHATFLQRLQFILHKIELEQKSQMQSIVEGVLSPKQTLLETTKHRTIQGRHEWKEKITQRRHSILTSINQYLRFLTLGQPHDVVSYQAAHVIPFPAFFALRESRAAPDDQNKKMIQFRSACVSIDYIAANPTARDRLFTADIETLFAQHHHNPTEYLRYALNILMKVALEEASMTVHLPSIFNQEVDGISEKYITLSSKDADLTALLSEHQKKNQSARNSVDTARYTERIYKYILSLDLFSMVKEGREFTFSEVIAREANYISEIKLALTRSIDRIASMPKTLTNLILAKALLNVFFGLKNAEALAQVDYRIGEENFFQSVNKLVAWVGI